MAKGKGEVDEFCKLFGASAIYCAVILLVVGLIGFGTAKIVVGANNLQNCSIEKLIPIWLVVSGLAPLMFSGFSCQGKGDIETCCQLVCGCVGFLFSFAWLICGTVWVYPNYGIVMSKDFKLCKGNETVGCSKGDCDKSLLGFAFAMVTIDWMLLLMWIGIIAWLIYRDSKK
ncbi:uncharacterized protein LOC128558525 [Mercenaria mercenaria]|uniref:uncharacterized protein LOC128558525 n=1 Tax=Mercenaria mercenaria TaxID=6596 RepID=UPI00234EEDF8|nr:uncharacterized protein LOC128558525 [Mercenaria mercenaria]